MAIRKSIKYYWQLLSQAVAKFIDDNSFTWAAALSYYTIFSLPPMLFVILFITTGFYDEAEMRSLIFGQISELIGPKGAAQLANTVDAMGVFDQAWWVSAIGIGGMLITSTTVFITLQNALNHIFEVKAQPNQAGWLKMLKDRLLSFSVVLGIAFILLVSLMINAILGAFGKFMADRLPDISLILIALASFLLPLAIITLLFALLFKYLPDAKISWSNTWRGAIITAVLFSVGKDLIGLYIGRSQTANLYDAAGSVLVLMVWVFYASLIFLFGAVITAIYVKRQRGKIEPESYAVRVKQVEIEVEKGEEALSKDEIDQ